MADKLVIKGQPFVSIGGNDISDFVASASLNVGIEDVDVSTFSSTARQHAGGLENSSLALTIVHADNAALLDGLLFPLRGTSSAFIYRNKIGAASTSNPQYTGNILMTDYVVGGDIGSRSEFSATWPVIGAVARAVT